MAWLFVSRTHPASRALAAYSRGGPHAMPQSKYTPAVIVTSFFLVLSFVLTGKPPNFNPMPVGLAVLLDGISIQNTQSTIPIQNAEARVYHAGDWYTARFGSLEPRQAVALFYHSFTNSTGTSLPAEIYSPSQIQISSPAHAPHIYKAEVNGQNPRVSAQWSKRLGEVLPSPY
jgi:hypothetical protein